MKAARYFQTKAWCWRVFPPCPRWGRSPALCMVFLHLSPGCQCSVAIIWLSVAFNLRDLALQIIFINVSDVEAELFSLYLAPQSFCGLHIGGSRNVSASLQPNGAGRCGTALFQCCGIEDNAAISGNLSLLTV